MRVFKFGGASVRNAEGIKNLSDIVSQEKERLVVVISAFGKTTNALEQIHTGWRSRNPETHALAMEVSEYHLDIARQLFGAGSPEIERFSSMFREFSGFLERKEPGDYDHDYDMIVSHGEIWSTLIVEAFLRSRGLKSVWADARKLLITDDRHRDAGILWTLSQEAVSECIDFCSADIYVTQGFIGATQQGETTTLGREGSDYSAALFANMLDATDAVVWKDVPGIMNADPDWMPSAVTLPHISYLEAVEMTYSGAKVIHPKTIKPLHNKGIPMIVRSFADREAAGTLISEDAPHGDMCPVFVRKPGQMLLSLIPKDLSFVMGDNLAGLFSFLAQAGLRVNLVQTGAVSINICIDHEEHRVDELLGELRKDYTVLYNEGVEMLTVRHSTPEAAAMVTGTREVLLSQKTRNTVRLVVR